MAWTPEQTRAINLEGMNIIVSAGAGSGKTAVLTERAKRKVLDGVHINELLILTFTNAAAAEMKARIRDTIKKTAGLENELNLIDNAYITTFDAFSLAILKKYHTKLNITNNIKVTDQVVIDIKKKEILDEIFDENYLTPKSDFIKLVEDFCFKDDADLKKYILNVYEKIELKYDKTQFIENYFDIYNGDVINSFVDEYISLIKSKQSNVINLIDQLYNYFDDDFVCDIKNSLSSFLSANTYDEFLVSMDYKTVRVPRNASSEGKKIKSQIYNILKDIRDNLMIYSSSNEIIDDLESTKENISIIVQLIKQLDRRLDDYKIKNNVFSFNDIARLAIKVVSDNNEVREELTRSFKEIMIDEYQDTSDIQEKFISLIANNNVYMVGDVKQSIYRFRNANPYIFKEKYDKYRDTDMGEKIDLLKNFRSRSEVLDNINLLFDSIMDDQLGGADYEVSHRMVFGNQTYLNEGKTDQNYNLDVVTYNKDDLGLLSMAEEEAFIIGNDILDKINNKYKVFDKGSNKLRDCKYSDFVILLDKSRDFDLYKKIFEYLQIPLAILKEESLKKDNDVLIFKNLLRLIICIKDRNFNNDFKYSFVSVSRSFLCDMSDTDIYDFLVNNSYENSSLYKTCLDLANDLDVMSPKAFFRKVLDVFQYESKLLSIGNIKSNRVRCEYIYNLIGDFASNGGTIRDFHVYLDQIINEDYDLKFNVNSDLDNNCMIMTIHKSKGLEYPICYYAGLSSRFNISELRDKILFDDRYGIILPKVDGYYKDTITKLLLKNRVRMEEVSEKIRLFYVALTRAKEKMIIVIPEQEEDSFYDGVIPLYEREKYMSFLSVIRSVYFKVLPYVKKSKVVGSKDYLNNISKDIIIGSESEKIYVNDLEIDSYELVDSHYSKESLNVITKEEKHVMDFGTSVHSILEQLDFNDKRQLDNISDHYIKDKIIEFLDSDLIGGYLDKKMYKEYEFIYNDGYQVNHGIIDLLIDNIEEFIIIDYKLKNIDSDDYDKQLNGYKKYIEKKTGKRCRCFLYSIINGVYREIIYTK